MDSEQIRETYLSFFEDRGHLRVPSASLIPAADDPSVLLTTAGMQPFQPYFLGREEPPAPRLTSCQRCFRTPDIESVGSTARHLTCFEMLGNFAFGDYFKREAIDFAWELSLEGFGFDPEDLWVTVFGGDDELGLGPDTEAIELWRERGVPAERIVELPRAENFWQAGSSGPCGPCSELYIDRGIARGAADDRPGDDSDRFIEYWNLVFTAYDLHEDGSLSELPAKNIDTGLGLERLAAIKQGVDSVFDTDLLRPLVDLGIELSGRSYGEDAAATRALRIIADHVRGSVQLIADGVVPSNERRGYVLRRIMRRAIHQGRVLGLEAPYLGRFAERAIELLAPVNPRLEAERDTIMRWIGSEEESFGRTLDRGSQLLERLIDEALAAGTSWIAAESAFALHDTYGFPYDLTRELVAERGLSVDDEGFEELMDRQRERARSHTGFGDGDGGEHDRVIGFVGSAPESRFVGYEELRAETGVAAVTTENGEALVKLEESPFYAEGGGQVADAGTLRWQGGEAAVVDVYRVGSDQALKVRGDAPEPGSRVEAEVARLDRHATMRNHTATHLLHAALRERLGTHVRQAGSAVRPDKLRFDFTHGSRLAPQDLDAIADRINGWIKDSAPVRAIEMDRAEAERLGAMALFGEKYGDWVRVVEVEGVSRELCGGTHVTNTAEVGIFEILSEGSSASNVRRIEAVTGPAAIDLYRERSDELARTAEALGGRDDPVAAATRLRERLSELESAAAGQDAEAVADRAAELAAGATSVDGIGIVVGELGELADAKALLGAAHDVKARVGDAAVVLAATSGEKVSLVAAFSPAAVERGISAADVISEAAGIVGGGGGGRPEVAQAGGRHVDKIGDALSAAREAVLGGLGGDR
ncbi:MAG TPA: alanine--tRNA ligase [Solirubrobacterales bacterium]|nr:alanine--tRNA ligase [Solirubrobacterales bacterium]